MLSLTASLETSGRDQVNSVCVLCPKGPLVDCLLPKMYWWWSPLYVRGRSLKRVTKKCLSTYTTFQSSSSQTSVNKQPKGQLRCRLQAPTTEVHTQRVRNLGVCISNKYTVRGSRSLSKTVLLFTHSPGTVFSNTHCYSQWASWNDELWLAGVSGAGTSLKSPRR